jgi:hypothetical protein
MEQRHLRYFTAVAEHLEAVRLNRRASLGEIECAIVNRLRFLRWRRDYELSIDRLIRITHRGLRRFCDYSNRIIRFLLFLFLMQISTRAERTAA